MAQDKVQYPVITHKGMVGMSKSLICAHAGAENSRDNSLESIAMLLDCGADLVEVDLWGPSGGALALCHDRPGPGEAHPLFAEALGLLAKSRGPRLNVDIKEPGAIFPAWNLACELGLEGRVIFTGDVSWQEAQEALKARLPLWLNHYLLPFNKRRQAHQAAFELGFAMLNISWRSLNERMLSEAPERLSVWTVNEEARLGELLARGVGSITTRTPIMALKLRRERQGG